MRYVAITLAALALVAGAASAELCDKCKDGIYIMSVGKCVECAGHTGSGAFKLCKACSAKLGQCEHCRAALKPIAKKTPGEPVAKIDLTKSGVYTSGKWEYRYEIKRQAGPKSGYYGRLLCGGWEVAAPDRQFDYYSTPWGRLYWMGQHERVGASRGWLPGREPLGFEPGKELPGLSMLMPIVLNSENNGKTRRLYIGQEAVIRLPSNPTTGFAWTVKAVTGQSVVRAGKHTFLPPNKQRLGAGGLSLFPFWALKAGKATVALEYKRHWELDVPPAKTFKVTFDVGVDPAIERAKHLKADPGAFQLALTYYGPERAKYGQLVLRAPKNLTPALAVKIIDYLAVAGHLSRMLDISARRGLPLRRMRIPTGPTYWLSVDSGRLHLIEDLGWNLEMLGRLDALHKVLEGTAAQDMGLFLDRLAEQRKKWRQPKPQPAEPK